MHPQKYVDKKMSGERHTLIRALSLFVAGLSKHRFYKYQFLRVKYWE